MARHLSAYLDPRLSGLFGWGTGSGRCLGKRGVAIARALPAWVHRARSVGRTDCPSVRDDRME